MQRRTRWLGLAALAVALGVLTVSIYWWLGWPRPGPGRVSDRTGVMSFQIPAGWIATTPHNARQIYTPLVGGPSTASDLELRTGGVESGTTLYVRLDTNPPDATLTELHALNQAGSARFKEKAVTTESPVHSWESLASMSELGGEKTEFVTVRSEYFVVTVFAIAPTEARLQEANNVMATLNIKA